MPKSTTSKSSSAAQPGARVAFLHPDLGIGGAERLVVDAALGLQQKGYDVTIYTSHHDKTHCFEETRDGTLKVVVRGDWLPTKLFGRCMVLCAILRSLYTALSMCLLWKVWSYDVVVVDQLSISIPLLKFTPAKIIFYCHFPDMLLTPRTSLLKKLYRLVPDYLEEVTTGQADSVLVNSKFTASTFRNTFKTLSEVPLTVLYPAINFKKYDIDVDYKDASVQAIYALPEDVALLLSINRFERKKDIQLAILGLLFVKARLQALKQHEKDMALVKLVIAGGYDTRVAENVEHNDELEKLCVKSGLKVSYYPDTSGTVIFLRSFSNAQRTALFDRCCAVLYTPSNEHFGIVPVEAMYSRKPVIACASGGPTESVLHTKTGFLCQPTAEGFGGPIETVLRSAWSGGQLVTKMGRKARAHVVTKFGLEAFARELDATVQALLQDNTNKGTSFLQKILCIAAVVVGILSIQKSWS